jgi:DNA-directed RNA polymerase specialized sigma24 family protein
METLELKPNVSSETANQILGRLYKPSFLQVARYVSKHGGSFEDAKDIFHDALAIFYEQYQAGKSIESEVNYITGIAKHLYLRQCKRNSLQVELEENLPAVVLPTEPTLNEVRLLNVLERTGKRCMDLLVSFYTERLSLEKISQRFQFSSEHSASVQKYKCLEKVREVIKTKSIAYEDFFE